MPDTPHQPRDGRLRKHADYQHVYQQSRKHFSPSMTYFFRLREDEVPNGMPVEGARVGLTAGRVLGKAVDRNRIKRRMREAVRAHLGQLPSRVDVVLHPRKSVKDMDFARLSGEVSHIFGNVRTAIEKRAAKAQAMAAPGRIDPARTGSGRPGSGRTGHDQTESSQTESNQTESNRTESNRTSPPHSRPIAAAPCKEPA